MNNDYQNSPTHADVGTSEFEDMLLDQLANANSNESGPSLEKSTTPNAGELDFVEQQLLQLLGPNHKKEQKADETKATLDSFKDAKEIEALMKDAFVQAGRFESTAAQASNQSAEKHFLVGHKRLNGLERQNIMTVNSANEHEETKESSNVFGMTVSNCELLKTEFADGTSQWEWCNEAVVESQQTTSIEQVQFGLLSPDDIRRMSVVEITTQRLFNHNVPVDNGLYDRRMGSVMRQFGCSTCEQKFHECPGHFGRIELAAPLYHPSFLDTVVRILNTICVDCSGLLVPKTKRFVERQARCKRSNDRLRVAHDLVKNKTTNKQCCGTKPAQRHRVPLSELCTGVALDERRDRDVHEESRSHGVDVIQSLEEGCGHYQPKVMREGIKIVVRYPALPSKVAKAEKSLQATDATNDDADDKVESENDEKVASENDEKAKSATKSEKEYDRVRRERAGSQRVLSTEEVLKILQRISDEDCWLLGFDPQFGHPSWMMLTVLPVPPPVIRPPVISQYSKKPLAHDHLTGALQEIVKENEKLRKQIDNRISTFQENFKILLQFHVATYIDNDTKGVPKAHVSQSSEKERDGITQRFKGKEGRLRGNLMGKRVNFCARTVITPDPNLAINELGVPEIVARGLTIPERVNRFNIERLQRSVLLGPDALCGAKSVIDERGEMYSLQHRRTMKLKLGHIVERHLRNGDIVAFNRQPSLHKYSIMAHRVRIMPGNTFRINLSVCGPYNADFDGDEMNMFVPQSIQAAAELATLMETSQCIVTPLNNKPIIGLCQDSLLAARLFTQRNVFLNRAQLMQLLMWTPLSRDRLAGRLPQPCIVHPEPLWTGKQIVSLLLPKKLHVKPSSNNFVPDEERDEKPALTASDCVVHIRHGTLLSGILDKKFVGTTHGSIVHVLNNDFGATIARVFMEEMQALLQCYVTEFRGMSVGIGDCMPDRATKKRVKQVVQRAQHDVHELVKAHRNGQIDAPPGMSAAETFEARMNQVLNKARDTAGRHVSTSFDVHKNNLKLMVTAGSKGGDVNIAQIAGLVGQQNLNGGRIPEMFRDRGMPHAKKFDIENIESRGFVSHSYIDGLTPTEMLMHAAGGREGLVDTACKSVIGSTEIYVQETGKVKRVEIGAWIDSLMAAAPAESILHEQTANLELLDLTNNDVFIPTVDFDGRVSWSRMTAVTRHDPGQVLYCLKTASGRQVTVTASKSVLAYDSANGGFSEIEPHKLVVGQSLLPVARHLSASPNQASEFCLTEYMPWWGRFEYSRANGFMFGVYLLQGETNDSDEIVISASNYRVKEFVEHWFETHNVETKVEFNPNEIGDAWITITGKSVNMASVFTQMFGSVLDKKMPSEFLSAPDEFVAGLFDGLLSGGSAEVTSSCISMCLTSESLVSDIVTLAMRFGAFATTSAHDTFLGITPCTVSFHAEFATKLQQAIFPEKTTALFTSDETFSSVNDVVLDKLVSIEKVDIAAHPKVYDVTVPSTLNFGIANGLMIRDTADIGYIQRRMIKAGEDVSVAHDGTVRTSTGTIVQFLYGDDGMDGACFEWQNVSLLSMSNAAVHKRFGSNQQLYNSSDCQLLQKEAELLIAARDDLRSALYPNTETRWPLPGNVARYAERASIECKAQSAKKVTVSEAIELLEKFALDMIKLVDPSGQFFRRTQESLFFYMAQIRSALSPRVSIEHYALSKDALQSILQYLLDQHCRWQVASAEGVGVLAAQAIGEPATQM